MEYHYLKHLIIATILLEFSQLSNGQCGFVDLAKSTAGSLTSPGWPQNYENYLNCTWNITSNPGTRIEIDFRVFSTEELYDVLAISSGSDIVRLNGVFCHPTSYISQTSSVQLIFQTDRSIGRKGFFATYKEILLSSNGTSTSQYSAACTSTIRLNADNEPRMLNSPGWPGMYLHEQDCFWTIRASKGRQINITFLQFATEPCCDYLEIFDGTSSTSPEEKFRRFVCPDQFLSKNDTVRLRFVSDDTVAYAGFQLIYQEASIGTELTSTTTTQTVSVDPFCPAQTLSGTNGSYSFVDTPVNSLASSIQLCNSTNRPLAAVSCLPGTSNDQYYTGGSFDEINLKEVSCGISLIDLRNTSLQDLPTIEVLTSQPDLLNIEEVMTAIEILTSLQEENVEVTESTLTSVVNTVSNLAAATDNFVTDSDNATTAKSTLISTLNNFASSIVIPENSTNLTNVRSANINVQAVRIAPMTSVDSNSSVINFPNFTFSLNIGTSDMSALITIPSQSIAEVAQYSSSNAPVFHTTVIGGSLSLNSSQNTSQIVSVSTTGSVYLKLSVFINFEDVEIPNPTSETANPLKRILNKAEVSSWDFDNFRWNFADRCQQDNPTKPEYQCQGFASYAVLFTSKEVPSILALTTVSYVGSILSILFLLATIFIHLRYREIRKRPTTMTLVNICICLTAVYFFYIVGVGRAQYKPTCDAMTFLLHYFTLTSMVWMTVNAVEMYKAFTQISRAANTSKPAIYFPSYGLPFLLVLINFCVTTLYLDKLNNSEDIFFESLYRYAHVCWLQAPSLTWGFVLPLGVLLLINYLTFILLLRKVLFRKQKIRSTAKTVPLLDRLVNAITMVTVMGLSWIFGYFLLIADDVSYQSIMQWLFTLTNTFQGVIIFWLYCVRREYIRKVWLPRKIDFGRMVSSSTYKWQFPKKSECTEL